MLARFTEFEQTMRRELGRLSHWHRIVYALLVCRRFRPYYDNFVRASGVGAPELLDRAEQELEAAIRGTTTGLNAIVELRTAVEDAVPDSKVMEQVEYAPEHLLAQDGAIVHVYALAVLTGGAQYVVDGKAKHCDELQHAWWLANSCYEAADREAGGHVLPRGGIYTPAVEAAIEESPPIQREIHWQSVVMRELHELPNVAASVEAFIERHSTEPLVGRAPAA